ncbi:MAG: BrnT family toxin [Candidatus Poribacteria bacterium]
MQINRVVVPPDIVQKIKVKHGVNSWEAEEIFFNPDANLRIRRAQGKRYTALGRTYSGRYLFAVYRLRGKGIAEIRTARDMTQRERRLYERR